MADMIVFGVLLLHSIMVLIMIINESDRMAKRGYMFFASMFAVFMVLVQIFITSNIIGIIRRF